MWSNGVFTEMQHPVHGPLTVVSSPISVGEQAKVEPRPAPGYGEHTREVLGCSRLQRGRDRHASRRRHRDRLASRLARSIANGFLVERSKRSGASLRFSESALVTDLVKSTAFNEVAWTEPCWHVRCYSTHSSRRPCVTAGKSCGKGRCLVVSRSGWKGGASASARLLPRNRARRSRRRARRSPPRRGSDARVTRTPDRRRPPTSSSSPSTPSAPIGWAATATPPPRRRRSMASRSTASASRKPSPPRR